jgi:hypothetical protein
MKTKRDTRFIRLRSRFDRIIQFRKKIHAHANYKLHGVTWGGAAKEAKKKGLTTAERTRLKRVAKEEEKDLKKVKRQRARWAKKLADYRVRFWLAWFAWPENKYWPRPGEGAYKYARQLLKGKSDP